MKDLARKAQFPLLFACAATPIAALLMTAFWPHLLERVLIVPALYVLLSMPCLLGRGQRRLATGFLCGTLLCVCGSAMLGVREEATVVLIPLGFSAMLLAGLRMAAWSHDCEPPITILIAGALSYAFLQFVVNVTRRTGSKPELQAALPMLLPCFWLFLLLAMLSLSRSALGGANWGKQRAPLAMRVKYTALCVGLWALTLLLSCSRVLVASLRRIWDGVCASTAAVLHALMNLIPENDASTVGGMSGGTMDLLDPMQESEPGALAVLLEHIVTVAAFVAMLALAVVALRILVKKLIALARALLSRLHHFAAVSGEDYVDEITDTRVGGEGRAILLPHLRARSVRGAGLSPRERIRHRYARLRERHPSWTPADTARETLPEDAARLYERARYSNHDITSEDVQHFERESRRVDI